MMDPVRATVEGGKGRPGPRSRTSDIYARLRDDIIVGVLAPGARLKIDELRERYDQGATPTREALSMLAADGLVERVDQRGFRVANVSSAEFEELLAVRSTVEERGLRLSIQRGGREWEEAVVLARYHLTTTPRLRADGNIDLDWERRHKDFHLSLVSACGSNLLLRLCNQLYDENNRYRFIARRNPDAPRGVGEEHEAIAAAALARDADLAVGMLMGHYRKTGELVRREFRLSDQMARTG